MIINEDGSVTIEEKDRNKPRYKYAACDVFVMQYMSYDIFKCTTQGRYVIWKDVNSEKREHGHDINIEILKYKIRQMEKGL